MRIVTTAGCALTSDSPKLWICTAYLEEFLHCSLKIGISCSSKTLNNASRVISSGFPCTSPFRSVFATFVNIIGLRIRSMGSKRYRKNDDQCREDRNGVHFE